MEIIAYAWFTGRASIGMVVYQNNYGKIKAVMTTVSGFDEEADLQHIVDYGSRVPEKMAIAGIDYSGRINNIALWTEFKKHINEHGNTDNLGVNKPTVEG